MENNEEILSIKDENNPGVSIVPKALDKSQFIISNYIRNTTNLHFQNLTPENLDYFMELVFDENFELEMNRTVRSFTLIQSGLDVLRNIFSAGVNAVETGMKTITEVKEAAINTTKSGLETAKFFTSFITEAVAGAVVEKTANVTNIIDSIGEKGSNFITLVANGTNIVANSIMKAIEAARATGTTEIIKGFFNMMMNNQNNKNEE